MREIKDLKLRHILCLWIGRLNIGKICKDLFSVNYCIGLSQNLSNFFVDINELIPKFFEKEITLPDLKAYHT